LTKECSATKLPKCTEEEAVLCAAGKHITQKRCCNDIPPPCHAIVEGRCEGLPGRDQKHLLWRRCCEASWPKCGICAATVKHLKRINREEERLRRYVCILMMMWFYCRRLQHGLRLSAVSTLGRFHMPKQIQAFGHQTLQCRRSAYALPGCFFQCHPRHS
jgi:hypothetical protein